MCVCPPPCAARETEVAGALCGLNGRRLWHGETGAVGAAYLQTILSHLARAGTEDVCCFAAGYRYVDVHQKAISYVELARHALCMRNARPCRPAKLCSAR